MEKKYKAKIKAYDYRQRVFLPVFLEDQLMPGTLEFAGSILEVIPPYFFSGITQGLVQGAVRRACLAAKLRTRSPHDLRHTYATLLLMDHYSPAYVQKRLGHHSIGMTVDIYGYWIPGEGKKDLVKTLRGPKAKPGWTISVVRDKGE